MLVSSFSLISLVDVNILLINVVFAHLSNPNSMPIKLVKFFTVHTVQLFCLYNFVLFLYLQII